MTQPVSSVTAVLPKDTVYTVNDSDVKVVDGRPSLLVDEIVSTDNSASGSAEMLFDREELALLSVDRKRK